MTQDEIIDYVKRIFKASEGGTIQLYKQAYRNLLADDCVCENSGLPTRYRLAASVAFADAASDMDIQWLKADVVNFTAEPDRVYSERIDDHFNSKGEDILAPKIMGGMVLRDGKIARWSDYYDPGPFIAASQIVHNLGAA